MLLTSILDYTVCLVDGIVDTSVISPWQNRRNEYPSVRIDMKYLRRVILTHSPKV